MTNPVADCGCLKLKGRTRVARNTNETESSRFRNINTRFINIL